MRNNHFLLLLHLLPITRLAITGFFVDWTWASTLKFDKFNVKMHSGCSVFCCEWIDGEREREKQTLKWTKQHRDHQTVIPEMWSIYQFPIGFHSAPACQPKKSHHYLFIYYFHLTRNQHSAEHKLWVYSIRNCRWHSVWPYLPHLKREREKNSTVLKISRKNISFPFQINKK